MRKEYDFSKGRRNKYTKKYKDEHPFDVPLDFKRLAKVCSPWPAKGRYGTDIYQSKLHQHWPYTNKTLYRGGIYKTVRLKLVARRNFECSKMSREQLVARIYREVGNAMYYPVVHHPEYALEHQAIEAFSMWCLISSGWSHWQSPKDIPKPWKRTAMRDARAHRAENKRRHRGQNVIWFGKNESDEYVAEHYMSYWKDQGRYIQRNEPIERMTKQELEAIYVIVCDSFENQC